MAYRHCHCGVRAEVWELRCKQCAISPEIRSGWVVLLAKPALRYRIVTAFRNAIQAGLLIAGALLATALLNRLVIWMLGPAGHTVASVLTFLIRFLALLALIAVATLVLEDLRNPPTFQVTVSTAKTTQFIPAQEEEQESVLIGYLWPGKSRESRVVSAETPLDDVKSVEIVQDPLGRWLNYGDVRITFESSGRSLLFRGITRPSLFKERVEWLIAHQPLISALVSQPGPAAIPSRSPVEELRTLKEVDRRLRYSLWLLVPATLLGGNVLTFILGFFAGLILGPLLAIVLVSLWSALVLGVSSAHATFRYGRVKDWPRRLLLSGLIACLNGAILAVVVYGLGGRTDAAQFAAVGGALVVLFVAMAFNPEKTALADIYEIWEESSRS